MKTIKLSPKKLDRAADEYFAIVAKHEKHSDVPVSEEYIERTTLAGIGTEDAA